MSERPWRVAVIGAGYFGRLHVNAWCRLKPAVLVAICDRDLGRAEAVAAETGACAVFEDVEAMMSASRPDLVDIAVPPEGHLPLIEALAPRVSHLICQKPFCGGLKEARKAVAVAERCGCRLAVHENVRFQPWYAEARRLIEAGVLGEPWRITFRLRPGDGRGPDAYLERQPYFQKMERFLVHETAVHWIDTFRFLMGEVTHVQARLARRNPVLAGEDSGLILFGFGEGRTGLFDADRSLDHASGDPRRTLGEMLLEGSEATLRLDGSGRLWLRRFGSGQERPHLYDWIDRHFGGDCVRRCCEAILSDWQGGRSSGVEGVEYLRNLAIAEAIYESAATNRGMNPRNDGEALFRA